MTAPALTQVATTKDDASAATRERLELAASLSPAEEQAAIQQRRMGKFAAPRPAAGIAPAKVEWLWQGFIPLGALSLLYGQEGEGKSAFAMALAAMITRGELPGALEGKPANVEIFAFEDDAAGVLVPRLAAAGADLSRVLIHGEEALPTLPDDVDALEAALSARPETKLVLIDPLSDTLREGLKDNNNADVRTALRPLNAMAARLGVAVLGIAHPNKGATDAANKVMGSKAWRSVPRAVLLFGLDPEDPAGDSRIVAVSKANFGPKRSERVALETFEGQPRARLMGPSNYTDADVLLANLGGRSEALSKGRGGQKAAAEALIYRLLDESGGEVEARVAYAAGEAVGISEKTMRRARRSIGASEAAGVWKLETGLEV